MSLLARTLAVSAALVFGLSGCSKVKTEQGAVISTRAADPKRLDAEAVSIAREAAKEHKRVLVYFHADWCGPCLRVGKAFERAANRDTFANWVIVQVNVDELPSGPALGIQFESIPFFVKLDSSGKAIGTLDGQAFGVEPPDEKVDEVFRTFLRT
jgi:thioredoxin-like negative regulator of GroEL